MGIFSKSKKIILFLCFGGVLFLNACGKHTEITSADSNIQEEIDIISQSWKQPGEIDLNDVTGSVVSNLDDISAEMASGMERGDVFASGYDNKIFICEHFYSTDTEKLQYIYTITSVELETLGIRSFELNLNNSELDDSHDDMKRTLRDKLGAGFARVTSIDANEQGVWLFVAVWDDDWILQNMYTLLVESDGTVTKLFEINMQLVTTGKISEETQPPVCRVNKNGNICINDRNSYRLSLINELGVLQYEHFFDDAQDFPVFIENQQGECICEYSNLSGTITVVALDEEKCKQLISNIKQPGDKKCVDTSGNCIYLSGEVLASWNISTGRNKKILGLEGYKEEHCLFLFENSSNDIFILSNNKTKVFLYKITQDKSLQVEEKTLELLQLFDDPYTENCAAEYSRTHQGVKIKVVKPTVDSSFSLNKVLADIEEGNGPDFILLNQQQMKILYEAGVLQNIDELIDSDIKEQIFNGALDYCRFEEGVYGIPYEASLGTLMVSNNLIEKRKWNLEDIISIWNNDKKHEKQYKYLESMYYTASAEQLLYDFCLQQVDKSPFVNMDAKTCSFDSQLFCELLEMCKYYSNDSSTDDFFSFDDRINMIKENRTISLSVGGGLIDYSTARATLGDDYSSIGYPTDEGGLSLIHCYRFISVCNNNIEDDTIKDFLNYLLSEDSQIQYSTYWVRKDLLRNHVKENTELSKNPIFIMDNYEYTELPGREDGSSYLDEYIDLMDRGSTLSKEWEIRDIVIEEAGSFFAGDKTAEQVATIIQNRVQIYLNE